MAFNNSWLYHYGWKILPENPEDLRSMKHQRIIDVSRFYIYSDTKDEVIGEFLTNYSDQLSDFIAFQFGILMLHLERNVPSFLDDLDRFQLHYCPDFTEELVHQVIKNEFPEPNMIFSARENPEFANSTILNMIGKTIIKLEILRFKALRLWQEDYPRLGGLRLTLDDNSEVYIETELRDIEDRSGLCVLSPDQVNFSRIEEVIEV